MFSCNLYTSFGKVSIRFPARVLCRFLVTDLREFLVSSEQQDTVQRVVRRDPSPRFSGLWVVFAVSLTVFFG